MVASDVLRPFRFGLAVADAPSGEAWRSIARRAELLGYDVLLLIDHVGAQFAAIPALMAAADATTRLRVGPFVLDNNFRNPVLLARELATIDLLSDGRLEIGLGAGWIVRHYARLGIPYEPPGVRVSRLIESVGLMKRLFTEDEITHEGEHYASREMSLRPKAIQRPHPPLMIGGGSRRLLSFAAREADIVALAPGFDADGRPRPATFTPEAVAATVAMVREAAGPRAAALELNAILFDAAVIDERDVPARLDAWAASASIVATTLASLGPRARLVADLADSPFFLYGSVASIVSKLRERRERFGISYVAVPFHAMDAFAPVVAELREPAA